MIGVDVGETRVRVELFDLTLTELARAERPLEQQRYEVEVIVGHIRDGIAEVLAAAGKAPEQLLGVGIGVPGIVEHTPDHGAVVHGQTMGWDAVPLEELLRSTSQLPDVVPYFIDNGAKTLGQAEMWFGGGRGAQRDRRPLRLRCRRLPRHSRGGERPGGRVGSSDRTGQGPPLPLRGPGLS